MEGAQPSQPAALAEGLFRKLPPSALPRLLTNGSISTKSSDDKDTKPTAARKRKKSKKSKPDRIKYHGNKKSACTVSLAIHLWKYFVLQLSFHQKPT